MRSSIGFAGKTNATLNDEEFLACDHREGNSQHGPVLSTGPCGRTPLNLVVLQPLVVIAGEGAAASDASNCCRGADGRVGAPRGFSPCELLSSPQHPTKETLLLLHLPEAQRGKVTCLRSNSQYAAAALQSAPGAKPRPVSGAFLRQEQRPQTGGDCVVLSPPCHRPGLENQGGVRSGPSCSQRLGYPVPVIRTGVLCRMKKVLAMTRGNLRHLILASVC